MADSPDKCPTCGTAVPEGAVRCVACGRVFGEENRCPHCNAVAAVIQRRGRTVCAACGKPRAGATLLGDDGPAALAHDLAGSGGPRNRAALVRAQGRGQRAFGILALGGGVLMAVLAAVLLPGAFGVVVAAAAGLLGVGLGALSIRAGARNMTRADTEQGRSHEMEVLALAEEHGGDLTASRTAKALGITLEEADDLLTRMVGDGSHISVDVDTDGVVHYVFRELVRPEAAKVRVDAGEAPEEEALEQDVDDASADRERSASR